MSGDDHERATCSRAGEIGHWTCGMCREHDCPRFQCGCMLRMSGETDGLGRRTPGTVRLALILEHGTLTAGPRDAATIEWLEKQGGALFCGESMRKLSEHWLNRGVSRRDLPIMAAELERLIADRYRAHAEGHNANASGRGWYHPKLTVGVRACEYVAPPPTHLELVEIR
jgi:hypothetical protein